MDFAVGHETPPRVALSILPFQSYFSSVTFATVTVPLSIVISR